MYRFLLSVWKYIFLKALFCVQTHAPHKFILHQYEVLKLPLTRPHHLLYVSDYSGGSSSVADIRYVPKHSVSAKN